MPWFLTLEAAVPTVVTSSDFAGILSALQSQISVTSVLEVLAYIVGAVVGLVFMWWGVRQITSRLMKAFKKGKA